MARTCYLYINLWIYQLVINSQTVPWPWQVSNYNVWDEQEEQSLHAQNSHLTDGCLKNIDKCHNCTSSCIDLRCMSARGSHSKQVLTSISSIPARGLAYSFQWIMILLLKLESYLNLLPYCFSWSCLDHRNIENIPWNYIYTKYRQCENHQ